MSRNMLIGCWAFIALSLTSRAAPDGADEPPTDPRQEYLLQRQTSLAVTERRGARRPARLHQTPLIRWNNPISGAYGGVYLWTVADRPVSLAKSHLNDRKQHYVCSSITLGGDLNFVEGKRTVWTPAKSTAREIPLGDLPPPRGSAALRLTQMRKIAESFQIEDRWGEDSPEVYDLRLLPRPLYRYEVPDEGVLDGVLFAYAQGTNPEAVVLIEAVDGEPDPHWRCRLSRMTRYPVTAQRNERTVLEVPRIESTNVRSDYHHHYEPLRPYPFADAE